MLPRNSVKKSRRIIGLLTILILVAFNFLPAIAEKEIFSWAEDGNYQDALTDRSNNVGVYSEGYSDSPYTISREILPLGPVTPNLTEINAGGTLWLRGGTRQHIDQQYWDGKRPFRVTPLAGAEGQTVVFNLINDFLLEDDDNVVPYGALKFDHINFTAEHPKQNLYGRGNKLVIGEGVTTTPTTSELIPRAMDWRIYGGTEHNRDISGDGRPDLVTNIVAASGHWNYIFGGGEGATGTGTQVTVRGNAEVDNLYGGGERRGSIGVDEPAVSGDKGNPDNPGINVYIEDGAIGTLYGGCAINGRGWLTGNHALAIYEDIKVNVSGGHVDRLIAGSDTHDDNGDSSGVQPVDYSIMGECEIHGDATVNLSAPNAVDVVVGDINRNLPRSATNVRQVLGATILNVTADQEFQYAELFDRINIDGSDVKILNDAGFRTFDSDYSSTEGYVGQIVVTNGGRLELGTRGIINEKYAHYNTGGSWQQDWTEPDKSIKASANHQSVSLRHGWVGEANEEDRADSVIAIDGDAAGITAASGTAFNDARDICGLLIHGSVGSDTGWSMQGDEGNPGYSTLEVLGDPIYSTGDDYYYYIVADGSASNKAGTISKVPTSVNGGAAFKEPEGADYMVCYRYLDDGKIGWYLRERPEVSAQNTFVHRGDQGAAAAVSAHVEMNDLKYEWSDVASQNHTGIKVRKVCGSDSVTTDTDYTITAEQLADIANDQRFSNIHYDSDGYLESFDLVIDDSQASEACRYEISPLYIQNNGDSGDDVRIGTTSQCARCIYDFVNTGDPSDADYQDSIMTTTPYGQTPKGEDKARLLVQVPYGCAAAALTVSEDDGNFNMTDLYDGSDIAATLHSLSQVSTNYASVTTQTANTAFAVEIDGDDLLSGIEKTILSGTSTYDCTVSSYKNVDRFEISNVLASVTERDAADGVEGHVGEIASQQGRNGLILTLKLMGITRDGNSIGTGNPETVNYGELRIMTKPLDEQIVPPPTGLTGHGESHGMVFLLLAMALNMAAVSVLYRVIRIMIYEK